jgi:hypothetical protein
VGVKIGDGVLECRYKLSLWKKHLTVVFEDEKIRKVPFLRVGDRLLVRKDASSVAVVISNRINNMDLNGGILCANAVDVPNPVGSVGEMDTIGIDPNLFDDTSRDPIVGLRLRIHPTRGKDKSPRRCKSRTPPGIG